MRASTIYISLFSYPVLLYVLGWIVIRVYKILWKYEIEGTYSLKTGSGWSGINLLVFLDNATVEVYANGELARENEWKNVGKEVHVEEKDGTIHIFGTQSDGCLIWIALIKNDGERTAVSKDKQFTYIKTE